MLAALALLVSAALGRSSRFTLPFAELPIPVGLMTMLGSVVLITVPLTSAVPELEPCLMREVRVRLVRAVLALVIAGCVVAGVAASMVAPATMLDPTGRFFLALTTVAVGAVVLVGDLAWLVPATLGYLGIIIDAGLTAPLSSTLAVAPIGAYWISVLGSVALYVWRGPRLPA